MILAAINGTADKFCTDDSDHEPISGVLKSIMQQSLAESRREKGDAINIGTLFVPEQLGATGNEKCWSKIFDALDAVSPHFVSVVNIRTTRHQVYTFPSDDCHAEYGKDSVSAASEYDVFLVLVLELFNSALKVSLMEITVLGSVFSALSTSRVSDVSWSTVDREELQQEVACMFRDQHVRDVRSVLFSAEYSMTEADEVAIQNIIEVLDKAAPGLAAKVHDFGLGIEYRNAIGAACIARQLVIYPFDPDRDTYVHYFGYQDHVPHDEL